MVSFDPSKDWDRHCQMEEESALFNTANEVAEVMKKNGVEITVTEVGDKMWFFQGKCLTAEWIKDDDGEIDVDQTAISAMVAITTALTERIKGMVAERKSIKDIKPKND